MCPVSRSATSVALCGEHLQPQPAERRGRTLVHPIDRAVGALLFEHLVEAFGRRPAHFVLCGGRCDRIGVGLVCPARRAA